VNAVRWTFTPDVDAGAGLRVAVLDVEAATVLAALEATRTTWERFPVRVLDAPKGGGKTWALARVVGECAVCVNDRKALAAQLAERFGAELPREPGSTACADRHQAENAPRIAVTLHTTPRLVGQEVGGDTLVVDEAIARGRAATASPRRPRPGAARTVRGRSQVDPVAVGSAGVWVARGNSRRAVPRTPERALVDGAGRQAYTR
jgi:hypothetical protein